MFRCQIGDLAFVIEEDKGCEGNIGKIVRVISSGSDLFPEATTKYGNIWLIRPIEHFGWWIKTYSYGCGRFLKAKYQLKFGEIFHPDTWLLPIRDDLKLDTINRQITKGREQKSRDKEEKKLCQV